VAEAEIRRRVDEWAKAFNAKDVDGIMACYSTSVVSFDVGPPLRYAGADNKRRAWQAAFAAYAGAVSYEVRELSVTTAGDLGFVHSLNHVRGTLVGGHPSDLWLRWTACFQQIDGVWLIAHDHVSVPADLAHGRALLDLVP